MQYIYSILIKETYFNVSLIINKFLSLKQSTYLLTSLGMLEIDRIFNDVYIKLANNNHRKR